MTETQFAIGEAVAIYQPYYGNGNVKMTTVERDTKLYWIADGRRFRKSDGIEPGSASGWNRPYYLVKRDDPRVLEAVDASRKADAYGKVCTRQNDLSKSRDSIDAVKALKVALDDYAKLL